LTQPIYRCTHESEHSASPHCLSKR
jgi:hypothetical protein